MVRHLSDTDIHKKVDRPFLILYVGLSQAIKRQSLHVVKYYAIRI